MPGVPDRVSVRVEAPADARVQGSDEGSDNGFARGEHGLPPGLVVTGRDRRSGDDTSEFGIVRLIARPLGIMPSIPAEEDTYFSRLVRIQNAQTLTDESQGMPASAAEASAVKSFGDLPLIVLTAKLNPITGWQEWQTELLQLSSNSEQLFAESDHIIHFEESDAAIAAILQMVQRVRETGSR